VRADEPSSDAALLRLLRRDPDAIGVLYDRHFARLAAYLRRCGADDETALDAAQEAFARLLVRGPRVRLGRGQTAWPWLAVAGRNLVRDAQRRGAVDARARRRLGIGRDGGDPSAEAISRVDAARLRPRLAAALAGLTAEQRYAVGARVLGGLEYAEIAAAAEVSELTARSRVSRGLRSLYTTLARERDG
jgi:RNA polymerase sigma-70 factor (ECF subfamily)